MSFYQGDPAHNDRSAVVIQRPDGRLALRCQHNSCTGQRWPDVLRLYGEAGGGLPSIIVNNRQARDITQDAIRAVQRANNPPTHFQMGGTLVRLKTRPRPFFDVVNKDAMRGLLGRVADWKRAKAGEEGKAHSNVAPPEDTAADLLALPEWPFPTVKGIVEAPVFTGQGSLVLAPGHDAASGLWHHPAPGSSVPPVPEQPSSADMEHAKHLLLVELLGDFPFAEDASEAHSQQQPLAV